MKKVSDHFTLLSHLIRLKSASMRLLFLVLSAASFVPHSALSQEANPYECKLTSTPSVNDSLYRVECSLVATVQTQAQNETDLNLAELNALGQMRTLAAELIFNHFYKKYIAGVEGLKNYSEDMIRKSILDTLTVKEEAARFVVTLFKERIFALRYLSIAEALIEQLGFDDKSFDQSREFYESYKIKIQNENASSSDSCILELLIAEKNYFKSFSDQETEIISVRQVIQNIALAGEEFSRIISEEFLASGENILVDGKLEPVTKVFEFVKDYLNKTKSLSEDEKKVVHSRYNDRDLTAFALAIDSALGALNRYADDFIKRLTLMKDASQVSWSNTEFDFEHCWKLPAIDQSDKVPFCFNNFDSSIQDQFVKIIKEKEVSIKEVPLDWFKRLEYFLKKIPTTCSPEGKMSLKLLHSYAEEHFNKRPDPKSLAGFFEQLNSEAKSSFSYLKNGGATGHLWGCQTGMKGCTNWRTAKDLNGLFPDETTAKRACQVQRIMVEHPDDSDNWAVCKVWKLE